MKERKIYLFSEAQYSCDLLAVRVFLSRLQQTLRVLVKQKTACVFERMCKVIEMEGNKSASLLLN